MFAKLVAFSLLSALGAQAVTHNVKVGAGGLVFEPAQLTVAAGDEVQFEFQAKNHTVTQSTFADPCKAKADGVNSGFMMTPADVEAKPTWTIAIQKAEEPLWFYCRQKTPASHCGAGMVFSINPTAEKSHDAFVEKAKAAGAADAAAAPAPAAEASAAPTAEASTSEGEAQPQAALSSSENGARAVMSGSIASALAVVGVVASLL